jgi:hypothetical protein
MSRHLKLRLKAEGKQEGAANEPQRKEEAEEGKEKQVGWKVSIQVSEVILANAVKSRIKICPQTLVRVLNRIRDYFD